MISIFGRKTVFGYCHMAMVDNELIALEFEDVITKEMFIDFRARILSKFKTHKMAPIEYFYGNQIKKAILISIAIDDGMSCPFPIKLTGTDFQMTVWNVLKDIDKGQTKSYADIAKTIGRPKAWRAVANACSVNPCVYFIPCHRVIASNGSIGGYRYGVERKRLLLAREGIKI